MFFIFRKIFHHTKMFPYFERLTTFRNFVCLSKFCLSKVYPPFEALSAFRSLVRLSKICLPSKVLFAFRSSSCEHYNIFRQESCAASKLHESMWARLQVSVFNLERVNDSHDRWFGVGRTIVVKKGINCFRGVL